jgi:hypothetical protein
VLTTDEARAIANEWRSKFSDPENYRRSIERYSEIVKVNQTAEGLTMWLATDLQRDQVGAALDPQEPVIPTLSRFDLNGCYHCYGRGYVRFDLPITHPEFGKAKLCPACHGRNGDQSAHCPKCASFSSTEHVERNQCWKCGKFQDELAGDTCSNPKWHDPNWTTGNYPKERPVPGWKTPTAALSPEPTAKDAEEHEHFQRMWDAAMRERLQTQRPEPSAD